ncbi:sulfatase family protein [Calycomorphotria hydatis]|uniref:Arylsulfatase n=1 Tax=Calycomorphotria hydatis TaxID=2528027 RepID=A0A517TD72_9PLAN|nr:sulfatase [Calycomorphotria hydatis]QDT66322.1 Arylsulfatase [Calycomorphotria hydatis]
MLITILNQALQIDRWMIPKLLFFAVPLFIAASCPAAEPQTAPPNILWIIAEDLCPDFGCYGNTDVSTPRIDQLASEGRLYTNAFATCPVCSPSRSALFTGMYQTSIGAHHHRSHRTDGYQLPENVKLLPERLRDAGYFSARLPQRSEASAQQQRRGGGKTDWNFTAPENVWDSNDWNDLKSHQPFFAVTGFNEAHRPYRRGGPEINPETITTLPAYIADHPIARQDWGDYLETLQLIDTKVGYILDWLDESGLSDNTMVCFFADNGREDFRGKSTAFDAGTRVPLIIRWPHYLSAGSRSDELVSLIDMTASAISLAGQPLLKECHGIPFLVLDTPPRTVVITARDRIENAVDRVRTAYDGRFRYIRNFMPNQPHLMERRYYDRTNPVRNLMRELNEAGRLSPGQAKVFHSPRSDEELYDLNNDPNELHNLSTSTSAEHQAALIKLRQEVDDWMAETGDQGGEPEPEEAQNATQGRRRSGRNTGEGGRGRRDRQPE